MTEELFEAYVTVALNKIKCYRFTQGELAFGELMEKWFIESNADVTFNEMLAISAAVYSRLITE